MFLFLFISWWSREDCEMHGSCSTRVRLNRYAHSSVVQKAERKIMWKTYAQSSQAIKMDINESGWRWCGLDTVDCGQGLVAGPFVHKNELWSTSFSDPALIVTEVKAKTAEILTALLNMTCEMALNIDSIVCICMSTRKGTILKVIVVDFLNLLNRKSYRQSHFFFVSDLVHHKA